jgi:hypothetical protein
MDRQRNWLGWAALALAGVALLFAIGGRFGGPGTAFSFKNRMMASQAVPAAPQAPQAPQTPGFQRGLGMQGAPSMDQGARQGRGDQSFSFQGRGDHGMAMGRGERHGFGPIGMIFGLFGALTKLAALAMLVWLLLRIFQQRQAGPPPAAPTTPAGHDPRVE